MKRFVAVLFCVVLLSVTCADSFSSMFIAKASDEEDIAQKLTQIADIEKKIAAYKNEYNSYMNQKNVADKKMKSINQQIAATESQIAELNSLISSLNKQMDEKTKEKTLLDNELGKSMELYKQRIRADYEEGQTTYLDVLFGSKSLSDFMTRLDIISQINEYNNGLMNDMKQKIEKLNSIMQSIEQNKSNTTNAKNKLTESKKLMASQYTENKKVAKELQNSADALKRSMAEEEKNSQLLNNQIYELRNKNGIYAGGKMAWPIPGYGEKNVSSEFGPRNKFGYTYHWGIDISTRGVENVPIVAANSGTVIFAGRDPRLDGGILVAIDHGKNDKNEYIITKYLHLNAVKVSVGEKVAKGQVIALSGSTGNSTGPHLHFEISVNNVRVNPRLYITPPK